MNINDVRKPLNKAFNPEFDQLVLTPALLYTHCLCSATRK